MIAAYNSDKLFVAGDDGVAERLYLGGFLLALDVEAGLGRCDRSVQFRQLFVADDDGVAERLHLGGFLLALDVEAGLGRCDRRVQFRQLFVADDDCVAERLYLGGQRVAIGAKTEPSGFGKSNPAGPATAIK